MVKKTKQPEISAEELLQVLKFTPTPVRIMIQGYGGEAYAGRVDRQIYDYFKTQKIDIEEYASSWDEFNGMPKEMMPFSPGSPFDCDNLFHASGAELSNLNSITVTEVDSGKEIWDYNMGWSELEEAGVTVDEFSNVSFEDDLADGEVAFWGGQGEKGCFFDAELTLTEPFDPKKLRVVFENCDGWCIVNYLEYDGEELDGSGGYSTTGKWAENKWIIGGDEEVYNEVVPVDEREDEGLEWGEAPESAFASETWDPAEELNIIFDEYLLTDWFPGDVKPVHKGEYECEFTIPTWPWPSVRRCEWTGKTWKESTGEKAKGEFRWRGLQQPVEKEQA